MARRWAVFAAVGMVACSWPVLADHDEDEEDEDGVERWRIRALLTTEAARPEVPFRAFLGQNLQWTDVDRDGRPEVLATNANGRAYLLDPAAGRVLAELPWPAGPGYDPGQGLQPGVVVGDLDGDGWTELHMAGNTGYMRSYEHAGPAPDGRPLLPLRWERCLMCWTGELDGTPWGAAGRVFLQHDGAPRMWALDAAGGATLWLRDEFDGNAGVVVADLDRDGRLEIVFATDNGKVGARSADDGVLRWVFDARARLGVVPGSVPGQPTVADLDGDGRLEVAAVARVAGPGDPKGYRAVYLLLDHTGALRWSSSVPGGNPMALMHPVPVDVNRDRVKDLLWLDWNTLGHLPGNFSRLGPAKLMALDGRNGAVLWSRSVDSWWSDVDLAVADADGDGRQEILVPERRKGADGISLFRLDGSRDGWWPVPAGWTVARGVLAAELEGRLHLVVSLAQPAVRQGLQAPEGTSPVGALMVVDTRMKYSAAWPGQYTFTT